MLDHRTPRTVLVTGASAGIGRFLALDLARHGHTVFAAGRDESALRSLAEEAAAEGLRVVTLSLDVTDPAAIDAAAARVRRETEGHGVDVLVNNAGYGQGGPLLELEERALRDQFDTNVFGLMAVTRAFVPEMILRGRGWIVNVSSVGGRVTFPFFGAYHASKYAVEALSDALRAELRPLGVRVAVVEPGPIRSKFSERAFGSLPARQDASPYAASYAIAPSVRTATDRTSFGPGHVARAVRRAIGSRFPRARYVAPWFLAIPLAFLPFVPTCLLDGIFRRVFRLHRGAPRSLARAAAALSVLVAIGLAAPSTSWADGGSWETIRSEDGILVSRKDVPGSPFVALRGEGDVDAPLLTVGSVLVDVPREKEWIDSIVEARTLRRVSDTEYVVYSHLGTPPTMSDRDFVADVTLSADGGSKTLTIRMHSVEDASAPKTSYVRGNIQESAFVLRESADGKKTHVLAEVHCDPKGSIAAWIVNLFQKNWGYKTIANLRRQAKKSDIAVNVQLRAFLESHGIAP